MTPAAVGRAQRAAKQAPPKDLRTALALLERHADRRTLDGLPRYGIHVTKAYGVPVGKIQTIAKQLGKSHELAAALWKSGWYEARLLAAFVDEPERVTAAQMDRWARDFDNWGICDTVCFHLFDRTPYAFAKIKQWSGRRDEFVKRGAFALLACVALHDKRADDAAFIRCLPLAEKAATDERNFVRKGVSWALRLIGRRNRALHEATVKLSERLAASDDATARWLARDVLRDVTRPAVVRRLAPR
jgi:3-methyladenine DNA glycosylase AlkD